MFDETHCDFADLPDSEYDGDYVCTNHQCELYHVSVNVRCFGDELGATGAVDERDLDCPCGAPRVEVESLGIEHVSPEIVKRYQGVGV